MNIRCKHCQAKLNVPDHKIPKDREVTFKCPKCSEKIVVSPSKDADAPLPAADPAPGPGLPAGFSLQELRRALILATEPGLRKTCKTAARQLDFEVETAPDAETAFKKMEYHVYPLVVMEEGFGGVDGTDGVLDHMNTLDMSLRRKICLVLVSKTHKTGDHMAAMHASVNYIIGPDGKAQMPMLISTALREHAEFYTVYTESLKATGKA